MNNTGKHASHITDTTMREAPTKTESYSSTNSRYQQTYSPVQASAYNRANYKASKTHTKKILLIALVALFAYAAFMGITAKLALDDMGALRKQGNTVAKQLFSGDITTAENAVHIFAEKSKRMRVLTNNPLWSLASFTPIFGTNIVVAQEYAAACDDLSQALLVPLIEELEQSNSGAFIRNNGSFNADSLKITLDTLYNASPTIKKHAEKVSQLKTPSISKIAKLHKKAKEAFIGIEQLTNVAPELASSIHYLLGADGSSRVYLVIAQNNAELRSTGGFVGSYGFLYVDNGDVSINNFQSIWELGRWGGRDEIIIGEGEPTITDEEAALFGRRIAMTPGDATIVPDFPRAASILHDQVAALQDISIDGVISIDPICLQSLLSAIGDVVTADGTTINSDNAATLLLHDTYNTRTAEEQDLFFSEVAQITFDKLFSDTESLDFMTLMRNIYSMQYSRDLLFWFNNMNAEIAFATLGYAGNLSKDLARPTLGIYLNNGAGSKISWYISENTSFTELEKLPDGSIQYSVTTKIKNNVTNIDAPRLSPYITGFLGDIPGKMRHWVYLIAPAEGYITHLESNGDAKYHIGGYSAYYASTNGTQGFVETNYNNYDVWYACIDLMPEAEETITYTVITSPQAQYQLALDESPTLQAVAGW